MVKCSVSRLLLHQQHRRVVPMARSSKPTITPETMVTMVVVWSPSSSVHTPSTPTMTASSGQGPGPAPATTWQ